MGELNKLGLVEARDALRAGDVTSAELTDACLAAIEGAELPVITLAQAHEDLPFMGLDAIAPEGAFDIQKRANTAWKKTLAEHVSPPLDEGVYEELRAESDDDRLRDRALGPRTQSQPERKHGARCDDPTRAHSHSCK